MKVKMKQKIRKQLFFSISSIFELSPPDLRLLGFISCRDVWRKSPLYYGPEVSEPAIEVE